MVWGSRKSQRIAFQRGIEARMVAIDGTWSRRCQVADISTTGARLIVEEAVGGLRIKEFFLALSTMGRVWRRCELVRVNGDELGVKFLKASAPRESGERQQGNAHLHDDPA
ncbi:PilZ domain-containing protein [Bradyrhizobium sp. LHD-71]|uniref:PilZ domain-containing protein n=1 Tax=Bradyrhizobium sp. LHD-71 TaxID=3072141 RepID=UPI00280F9A8D|nr:PilZ domain-containing protein [Bradyrhizobium sp. LHD-71]MDQ8731650.1 PilZ domain-containing protein [Bradyrhizobium sp. LHD-71]